nr:SLOG family protein [uncultured Bacillus sp.]
MKRLWVTGYKTHELFYSSKDPGIYFVKKAIEQRLRNQIDNEGLAWVIVSGLQGTELWAAEVVFQLQEDYPDLKLAVITPFLDQEKKWKEEKQEEYHMILGQADFVSTVTKRPYEGPWQFKARDRFLLDNTDGILLFYDEEGKEGSPKYIKDKAMKRYEEYGYEIITISAYDIQVIIEEEQQKTREWE